MKSQPLPPRSHSMFSLLLVCVLGLASLVARAQSLPYVFQNGSRYADSEIYIGLVGQFPGMGGVWMNMANSQLRSMSAGDNTLTGPAWATAPGGGNKYANMFTKLSDIPNKTIQIPQGLFGCRILISFKSPLYIYFHPTGGYAGANLQNPVDPSDGIRWELVELTWGDAGLWTNTSRVDAYQYPMGLEVTGFTGGMSGSYAQSYNARVNSGATPDVNAKIGEVATHETILNSWPTSVPSEFQSCKLVKTHSLDGEAIIEQPSKIPAFKSGGASGNFFGSYIDDIWATYRNKDLLLNIGDRGTWRGRVSGDRFDFYDPANNSQATIYSKPTTTDVIEGAGALASTGAAGGSEKYNEDLMIQAQVCAAINRHAIYTNTPDGVTQYHHDASRFFLYAPYNHYVRFFHDTAVSLNSKTYAFAYDDVGDHSSTIQCTFPTRVTVVIGGYGRTVTELTTEAGAEQTVNDVGNNGNESATLRGSAIDPKGGTISYLWARVSGSGTIASPTSATTNIDGLPQGSHTFRLTATASGASASDTVTINVVPVDEDLARGRPVEVSSSESASYSGSNAVDGNATTRWASQFNDNEWISVDLGTDYILRRVVLTWEAASGKSYKIQTSSDKSTWTDRYSTSTGAGGTETMTVSATARYVRMQGINRNTAYGYSLYSLQVYGTAIPVNFNPTVSAISNVSLLVNTTSAPSAFTIGDTETAAAALTLVGSSDNSTLLPVANIVFGGSGASRTVAVSPAANQTGTATVTVQVNDANGGSALSQFTVTVTPRPNTPPTITAIANQIIALGSSSAALPFTVGDNETAAAALTLVATSDNSTLLPTSNIVFGGSGASRNVTLIPSAGQTGTATLTIQVNDANGGSALSQFTVTVRSAHPMLDRNGDGISDVWAALYPTAGGPAADPDGDGQNNLAEAQAGTDPTTPNSRFTTTTSTDASGNVFVRWTGIAGKYYFVESSADLLTWAPLPGDYTGTGTALSALVRSAGTSGAPRTFWRVVVYDVDSSGTGLNDWEKSHPEAFAVITATPGAHGSISPTAKSYVAKGGSLAFTIAPSTSYTIDQVLVDSQSVGAPSTYTFSAITAGVHTISASFKTDTPANGTVTYDSQSASTPASPTSQTVTTGLTVGTLPVPPLRTGYSFSGWFTAANGGGTAFTSTTAVTSTQTVYAYWKSVAAVDLGSNVKVFDPGMSAATIQGQIDAIYSELKTGQFSTSRYAMLFKPGTYSAAVNVGYYTQALGLGQNPDAVQINGSIHADGSANPDGNVLCNFWRSAENMAVTPRNGSGQSEPNMWAVSQAAPIRRVHVKGDMWLFCLNPQNWNSGYASGGFMADCQVDGTLNSGGQQQYLFRNSSIGTYTAGVWNMVFVGPSGGIPPAQFGSGTRNITVVDKTPVVREKPFMYFDNAYKVFVPKLRTATSGVTWTSGSTLSTNDGKIIDVATEFFVAKPSDTVASINAALAMGKHLLLTPGIYHITDTIQVTRANTVVLGIGLATLSNDGGKSAMTVADVPGVSIAGVMFDAGSAPAINQLVVGADGSSMNHSANPTLLADLFFRVGGTGLNVDIDTSLVINSSDVIGDNFWIWRADHDSSRTYGAADWPNIKAKTALKVNGARVAIYGLAVEHYQQTQTIWNGEGGQVYFYQSEIPYDVPSMAAWNFDGQHPGGWPSYKVNATTHTARGLGIYCFFNTNPACALESAIEVPAGYENGQMFHNMVTVGLGDSNIGQINHVINQRGTTANSVSTSCYISE